MRGHQVDYVFGLARNPRLVDEIAASSPWPGPRRNGPARRRAGSRTSATRPSTAGAARGGSSARPSSWSRAATPSANPRFVVTSLSAAAWAPQPLYEELYCARGEMENRIKECQLDLFADRTSTRTMRANQLRLWFASMAYVLLEALRRIGLARPGWPGPPPARSASSCSRSARWCGSRSAGSRSRWRRAIPGSATGPSPTRRSPRRLADHEPDSAWSTSPAATLPTRGTGRCCPMPGPIGARDEQSLPTAPKHTAIAAPTGRCEKSGLARISQCAQTARVTSGGRFHPGSCRLIW